MIGLPDLPLIKSLSSSEPTFLISVLHDIDTFPAGFTHNSGLEVFNTYLQCNLYAPDGFKAQGSEAGGPGGTDANEEDEEICENDEPDRVRIEKSRRKYPTDQSP